MKLFKQSKFPKITTYKKRCIAFILMLSFAVLPFIMASNTNINAATYSEDMPIRVGLHTGTSAVSSITITAGNIKVGTSSTTFTVAQQTIEVGYSDGITFTKLGNTNSSSLSFSGSNTFSAIGMTVNAYNTSNASLNRTFALRFPNGALRINNNYFYTGFLELRTDKDGKLEVINVLPVDEYTKGVLPWEMSTSFHLEALKAQAVASRSWTIKNLNKHSKSGFNLCSTTCCQAYNGMERRTAKTDSVVDATKELVIVHDGKVAEGLYFSSSGGSTVSAYSFWGSNPITYSYLSAVRVPEEQGYMVWDFSITLDELYTMLKTRSEFTSLSGGLRSFEISSVEKNSDHVIGLKATDVNGRTVIISGGLNVYSVIAFIGREMNKPYTSTNFKFTYDYSQSLNLTSYGNIPFDGSILVVTENGTKTYNGQSSNIKVATSSGVEDLKIIQNQSNSITVNGKGWGHGVGMSQRGAQSLANDGFGFEAILKRFYTGVEIMKYSDL